MERVSFPPAAGGFRTNRPTVWAPGERSREDLARLAWAFANLDLAPRELTRREIRPDSEMAVVRNTITPKWVALGNGIKDYHLCGLMVV